VPLFDGRCRSSRFDSTCLCPPHHYEIPHIDSYHVPSHIYTRVNCQRPINLCPLPHSHPFPLLPFLPLLSLFFLLSSSSIPVPFTSRRPLSDARSSANPRFPLALCSGCYSNDHTCAVFWPTSDPPFDFGQVINRVLHRAWSYPLRSVKLWFIETSWFDGVQPYPAIIAWSIRYKYKRRKSRAAPKRLSIVFATEKSSLVTQTDSTGVHKHEFTLTPAPFDWVPQIRSVTLPSGVTVPPVAVTSHPRSPNLQDEYPPTPKSGPSVSPLPSPPPVYRLLGLHNIPVPPAPPEPAHNDIPPPTPMSKSSAATAPTPVRESFDLPPAPRPRSESFTPAASAAKSSRPSIATVITPKSLPRLMLVTKSFEPTRDDELALRSGETLRLIKEFEDEWCLVQRVGRPEAEKGVVPRFCLVDRPRIIKNRVTPPGLTFNGAGRK
jgi:Variant SH3 domain